MPVTATAGLKQSFFDDFNPLCDEFSSINFNRLSQMSSGSLSLVLYLTLFLDVFCLSFLAQQQCTDARVRMLSLPWKSYRVWNCNSTHIHSGGMNTVLHLVKATVWRDNENWKPQQYSSLVLGKFVPQFVANVLVLKFACACDSLLSVLQLQKSFRSIDTTYSQVFVVSLFLWIVLWKLLVIQG